MRPLFEAHVWRRYGIDSEGAELWVRDLNQTGAARLARLRTAVVDRPGAEAAGPDAVHVA